MRAFITDAKVLHLPVSISRSVVAGSSIGRLHTPGSIARSALEQQGQVPNADLVLACVRRWGDVVNDRELQQLCDLLDEMLDS